MGQSIDNLFADGFSGKMGKNMVFRQKKSGKIIVAKAPKKTRNPLKAISVQIRSMFKAGVEYAKSIMRNPENATLKAGYEAVVKGDQSTYNIALRDYCKPPKVTEINTADYNGVIGNKINIKAEDDFKVVSVQVAIYTMDNELVEQGAAVVDAEGLFWTYTATEDHIALEGSTIKATAKDLPGNEGSLEVTL